MSKIPPSHRSRREKAKITAASLDRLIQAITATSTASKHQELTHQDCEAALEFYVDAEGRGQKARTLYPAVWRHLRSCARCRASYALLADALQDKEPLNAGLESHLSPPALPFLAPQREDAPWTKHVRARVGGAPFNFGLNIRILHLQQRLSMSQPTMLLRGESEPAKRALALSDTISLGALDVMVKIWVQRLDTPEFVRLEILLASSAPLPDPLHVNLIWNDHTHSDVIHEGRFSFDKFPASALEDGGRKLRVEFKADNQPPVAVKGYPGGDAV